MVFERQTSSVVEVKYDNMVLLSMLAALAGSIMGIVAFMMPDDRIKLAGILAGATFVLEGLISLYKFKNRDGAKIFLLNMFMGFGLIGVGLLLILLPYNQVGTPAFFLGVGTILNGVLAANYGIWLKVARDAAWSVLIALGLLLVIIVIIDLFSPFARLTPCQFIGAFTVIDSILQLTVALLFRQRAEEIKHIFW